jgi:hypothetical protein
MNAQDCIDHKKAAADYAADTIAYLVRSLIASGLPADAVLAGAHASIIAEMTTALGGPFTAGRCNATADRVRNLPSSFAARLALATPAGTA